MLFLIHCYHVIRHVVNDMNGTRTGVKHYIVSVKFILVKQSASSVYFKNVGIRSVAVSNALKIDVICCLFLGGVLVFAGLICYAAAGLASGLAGGLAFTATAVLRALAEVLSAY